MEKLPNITFPKIISAMTRIPVVYRIIKSGVKQYVPIKYVFVKMKRANPQARFTLLNCVANQWGTTSSGVIEMLYPPLSSAKPNLNNLLDQPVNLYILRFLVIPPDKNNQVHVFLQGGIICYLDIVLCHGFRAENPDIKLA